MRDEVRRLIELGPFPSESSATSEDVRMREELIAGLEPPASDEEAEALLPILGLAEDSLHGLKWRILHFIESAQGWPPWDALAAGRGPWVELARTRLRNAGIGRPDSPEQSG